jgi:DNA (cytosine-5)-methyltransferase 1
LHDLVFDGSLLPTPKARDHAPEGYEAGLRRTQPQIGTVAKGIYDGDERILMPTPKALDGVKGNLKTSQERLDSGHQVDLPNVAIDLLGTPRATASESSAVQVELGAPKGRIEDQVLLTNWGKYEPAIRRWEQVLGRAAPAPTKPDGKGDSHRLSSEFTEWMMGLPAGWITGHGLKRNDELKMAGNGVVPQQAELALRTLLQGGSNE